MFPFISSLDDFFEARTVVYECIDQLKSEHTPCHENPKMGCMVELPAAVAIMDDLARETDFLCIGTNDLIQYLLAVDRTNESVSKLYIPHHPAVLRALKVIVESSIQAGRELSICGDMAADARMIPFLLGIGLRKFSMDPRTIPAIQKEIQAVDIKEAEELAAKVLEMGLISEVAEFLNMD
jgi:phosphotransferase system enzyme I (PtsP)